jgi:hypothetical protein
MSVQKLTISEVATYGGYADIYRYRRHIGTDISVNLPISADIVYKTADNG